VLEEALRRGHVVTALVRDSRRLGGTSARVTEGDALDPASVARAVAGQAAVITTLGPVATSPPELCSRATRILVQAMQAHGVRRLVMVTGAMVGHPRERLGLLYRLMLALAPGSFRERLEDRRRSERIVQDSGLDWTLVRPPRLTDDAPRGRFQAGEDLGLSSWARMPRGDLAWFLVDEVERGQWRGRAVAVAEP
jgi:putative NADH-flavin reductase